MVVKNNQIETTPKVLNEGESPVTGADKGAWIAKDVGGTTEGHFKDSGNNEIQLTKSGKRYMENLNEIEDVAISTPVDDEVLTLEGGVWKNKPAPSGGNVDEFSFTLPADADIASRIPNVVGLPAGWTLNTADVASEPQFGSSANTLVIDHNLTAKIALELAVFELTDSGPDATQGYTKVDLTTQGDQKTKTTRDKCAIIDLGSKISTAKDIVVFVKLI
jgi:hypothetical protein